MALGVNIAKSNIAVASRKESGLSFSKLNLAVASHPPGRVVWSKTNVAIASRPTSAWAAISKTNLTVASGGGIPVAGRRKLFVS
jgi:hypothetical protein